MNHPFNCREDFMENQNHVVGEGRVLVQIYRDGQEISRREGKNTVVQNGMKLLANRSFADSTGSSNRRVRYMQLGKSGTAPTSAQTNIITPIASATLAGRQGVGITAGQGTVAMSGARTAKWEHTWTAGEFAVSGLREVGLWNTKTTTAGADHGTMLARFIFTTVNKTLSDTIKITWTLRIQ
jgi:hypothetical protein